MAVTRRQFMKVSAAGLAASSVGALGFMGAGEGLAAGVRPFRLEKATETRNTCPYCAVACGVLIYSSADGTKDGKAKVVHIEGDSDNPINRGTLCAREFVLVLCPSVPERLRIFAALSIPETPPRPWF